MNGAGVSSSPPVARAGRAARTAAARKPAYVEVDDEESEQASAFEGEESDED